MLQGSVKCFKTTKGFGLMEPKDGGKDVFVHISVVDRAGLSTLQDGQKLSYALETGRDGRASAGSLKLLQVSPPPCGPVRLSDLATSDPRQSHRRRNCGVGIGRGAHDR
jgi:CspA family cold shock protein